RQHNIVGCNKLYQDHPNMKIRNFEGRISMLEFSEAVYVAARIATISANVEEGECEINVALKESKGQFWSVYNHAIPIRHSGDPKDVKVWLDIDKEMSM
ncbi:2908_t:CDS:2, partial [Funneliformis caledonium]